MKVAITGHTSGLGKRLYDHFIKNGHEVVGMSTSTGIDVTKDQDKIVEAVTGFDLFINNTHVDNCQQELLEKIVNKVGSIIVIGSAMHLFRDVATFDYLERKFLLSQLCRNLNVNPNVITNILHLNISFLPDNAASSKKLVSDNFVEFEHLLKLIDHWIDNPIFTDVTLKWKLTPQVVSQLEKKIPNLKIDLF